VSPQIEAGNVFLPDPHYNPNVANWVHDYVEEWKTFPYGSNDDQVDTTTQALIRATTSANAWLEQLIGNHTEDQVATEISKLFGWDMTGGSQSGLKLGF
jgi:hypothetical protein